MTIKEIEAKAREIKELRCLADEAQEAAEALQDERKAVMVDTDTICRGVPYHLEAHHQQLPC